MEKYFFDERNGLWYELQGDYYLPCLKLPEVEQQPVGLWGQRHLRYIKQNRKVFYHNLLTSGKLNGYLSDLDKQAEDIFSRPIKRWLEKSQWNGSAKNSYRPTLLNNSGFILLDL